MGYQGQRLLPTIWMTTLLSANPASNECADNLQVVLQCCQELGFPIAEDNCEGPKTCLMFLGFELDSVALEIRLSPEKLARLKLCVEEWRQKKSCKRKDLESLVGQLQHATHVVRPGRSFLRHMHELLARTAKDHHHIRLTKKFKADLEGGTHSYSHGMAFQC